MVDVELGIKGIIVLFDNDVFSEDEFRDKLQSFEKKEFIDYLIDLDNDKINDIDEKEY